MNDRKFDLRNAELMDEELDLVSGGVQTGAGASAKVCPSCNQPMRIAPVTIGHSTSYTYVCANKACKGYDPSLFAL